MKVRFKKLTPEAKMPNKAHPSDAGFDLTAVSLDLDQEGNVVYQTGIAVEIPEGYVGLVFPRSSVSKKGLVLTNGVGVIDSNYRGGISFKFRPAISGTVLGKDQRGAYIIHSAMHASRVYEVGERIGQLVIIPYPNVEFEETDNLSDTDRGAGGYGSTGK